MSNVKCRACGWSIHTHELDDEPACSVECAAYLLGWGSLELRRDEGGWRHYLKGEPVSCGSGLLLKPAPIAVPRRDDYESDYSYREAIRKADALCVARGEHVRVRYEAPLYLRAEPPALLYVDVVGHDAIITAHGGMRLRWPTRAR